MTDSAVLSSRLARRGAWRIKTKAKTKNKKPSPLTPARPQGLTPCVSQATRDRLIADALRSPAYEGMEPAEVSAFVNSKLDKFIIAYPWWFGQLKRDQPRKPVSDAQRLALEKARQTKAAIQLEATQPYIPSDLDSMEQDDRR